MKLSLRTKTTFGIILFALVLSTISVYFSYDTYRDSTNEHYYRLGSSIAKTAASQMDPGVLDALYIPEVTEDQAQEMMKSDQYMKYRKFLMDVKEANNVTYLYVVKPLEDGAYYLFDTDSSSETSCSLGFFEKYYDGTFLDDKEKFLAGQEVNPIISNEEFGWLLSAFHPVVQDGKMVAYICVDISMEEVITDRIEFLRNVSVLLAIVTFLFIVIYLWIINGILVKPINLLSKETARFVAEKNGTQNAGETSTQTSPRHGDEVVNLTNSIQTMEENIDQYIVNLTAVTAEKERIGAELNVATQIQADMLPSIFPPFPDRKEFDIYASMNPAKEVGGDFYDFFLADENHLAMVMADVSGKGVPAALFMVIAKTLLKNAATISLSPKEVLEKVNNQLCENNNADMFVTVWLGIYEISTGKLTMANAGHENPAVCRKNGSFELFLDKHGFVLAGMENMRYKECEIQLYEGDKLYLYTDGVPEGTDGKLEMYGTDRMLKALNQYKQETPEKILKGVKRDLDNFVGDAPQFDDVTMLGLQINHINSEKRSSKTE